MLESYEFTVRTRIKNLTIDKQIKMFNWLTETLGVDEWHFRRSKKYAGARAVYFRTEKQQLIFELAWSDIVYQETA